MKLRMLSESADIMTPLGKRPAERPSRWHNDWLRQDWSNWEQWGHQFDPSTCELITRDGLRVYLGWEMPGTAAVIMGKLDGECGLARYKICSRLNANSIKIELNAINV